MHVLASTLRSLPARLARLLVCVLVPVCLHDAVASGNQHPPRKRAGDTPLARTPPPALADISPPYLLVCQPPPLRFAQPVEPAEPAPAAPIELVSPPAESDAPELTEAVPKALDASAQTAAPAPPDPLPDSPLVEPSLPVSADEVATPTTPRPVGISILRDDTPRAIRAEDVLVYFRFPATAPSNDPPPRSSATYQQK